MAESNDYNYSRSVVATEMQQNNNDNNKYQALS